MTNPPVDPDVFKRLSKDDMKDRLRDLGQQVGGNKPHLLDRYQSWWNTRQPTSLPSAVLVDPESAATIAPVTTEAGSQDDNNVPLLERLLAPARQKLSSVTLDCLEKLKFTPGAQYRRKSAEKDFSHMLGSLPLFLETFLREMKQVKATSEPGENESTLREFLSQAITNIEAPVELTAFFADFGIDVRQELAAQPSACCYTEEDQKLLSKELDIVSCAIQHRLMRWATTFPKRSASEMLWPTTFSSEERKQIRTYVLAYVNDHDLLAATSSEEDQTKAVADMQQADDFPVPMAKTTAVIQAALLETRFLENRRSRNQSEMPQAPSRNASPVGRVGTLDGEGDGEEDDEEDDEEEDVVNPSKKRKKQSNSDDRRDHQGESSKRSRTRTSFVK